VKKLPFIGESKGLPLATSTWGFREKIATSKVVFSGQVTMSQNVRKFESDFSDRIGSNWSIMVNSGSSANLLAAAAFRLRFSEEEFKFRNEVLVPTVSWSTTYFPWHQLGFKLKFVDVSFADFNIDPKKVLKAIDEKTVGICIVHLLGAPANLESLKKLASEHDLFLFEDACEAMGSKIQSQNVGTFGDMGSFSTYFSHHISTGEGGFVVTDDEKTAHQLISLRAHGWLRNLPQENFVSTKTGDSWLDQFRFYLPGYNLRPMETQAAPGIIQLKKLTKFNEVREKNALHYRESLKQIPWLSLQQPQFDSTWFAFGHIINPESGINRKLIVEKLKEIGVESRPVVTGSFVKNPVVKLLNCVNANEDFEIADLLEERGFMIGNHPYDIRKRLDKLVKNLSQLI
jgi:CDP-6-deoxy-D-xylo-4-hexulose-3-dehydrase